MKTRLQQFMPVFKWLIKLLVSSFILLFIGYQLKSPTLVQTIQQFPWWSVFISCVFYLFVQWVCSWKWFNLLKALDIQPRSIWECYEYYLRGMFFSLFLPSAYGGDFCRAIWIGKSTKTSWLRSFLSIFAERLTGLGALLLVLLVCFINFHPPQLMTSLILSSAILCGAVISCCYLFIYIEKSPFWPGIVKRFKNNSDIDDPETNTALVIWPSPSSITLALLISLGVHLFSIGFYLYTFSLLGLTPSYWLIGSVYALSSLSSLLPVTLNGIGVREGTVVFLLVQWGHLNQESSAAVSLLWLTMILLTSLPGGLLYLRHQHRKTPPMTQVNVSL